MKEIIIWIIVILVAMFGLPLLLKIWDVWMDYLFF